LWDPAWSKPRRAARELLKSYEAQVRWLLGLVNQQRAKLGMARLVLTKATAETQRTQREKTCQKKSQADK
jgi:hypothetical protein